MQLTLHADYAMRVLLYLARSSEENSSISAIAAKYGISHNHLMKVVHDLGKAGYVAGVRGRYGGIRLARPAAEINIGDVIIAMEPNFNIAACHQCRIGGGCGLQSVFGEAASAFLNVLRRHSLADVVVRSNQLESLFEPTP